jgi:endonuclease YncB( thermonuclease family)
LFALVIAAVPAAAEPASRVFLNGVPAPVYFNDGDSFRVLGGKYVGTKARLAGFNTLESFGPVHQWGDWHAKELYFNAKEATYNAQRGVWHCESEDLSTDTYGRILWHCKDLAIDQIRRGLAHAMTVTADPSPPEFLAAQADAIKNRRGMWAHGVPDFILTSTHSTSEGGGRDGRTYNRLVSTKDGHSEKWQHADAYGECEKVCHYAKRIPDARVEAVVAELKSSKVSGSAGAMADPDLSAMVQRYVSNGSVGYMETKELAYAFDEVLGELLKDDLETAEATAENGCMVYVDFKRRYGGSKAKCLK